LHIPFVKEPNQH